MATDEPNDDEGSDVTAIIREYRDGGPAGPCSDCEELRAKVAELEARVDGIIASTRGAIFSRAWHSGGQQAARDIRRHMEAFGLCGLGDAEDELTQRNAEQEAGDETGDADGSRD